MTFTRFVIPNEVRDLGKLNHYPMGNAKNF